MSIECEAVVSEPPHYFHSHKCKRRASAYIDGRRLCSQHANVALRRKARASGVPQPEGGETK